MPTITTLMKVSRSIHELITIGSIPRQTLGSSTTTKIKAPHQQFDVWIPHLRLVAAAATLVRVRASVGDGHQTTQITHVDLVRIRSLKQTFSQELSRSVGDLTVTLHLAEAQTAVSEGGTGRQVRHGWTDGRTGRRVWPSPRAALHGLPVEDLDGASGPGVDLVVHHVLQTLVVGWTDEDLRRQLPARETVIENLMADQ